MSEDKKPEPERIDGTDGDNFGIPGPRGVDGPKSAEARPLICDPQHYPEDKKFAGGEGDSEGPPAQLISIADFSKVKLRTAEVVAAEEIPKADKLLKLTVKLENEGGETEQKQIVAGIKKDYAATHVGLGVTDPNVKPLIVGRTIIIVDNLQPTKLRGVDSNGMLLAVRSADGSLSLLTTDKPVKSGLSVS